MSDTEADAHFSVYYETYAASWTLYPDALTCLERRKQLGPLGLITNGSTLSQRDKVKRTGFDRWLDFIVISADVGCAKPDVRILSMLCNFTRVIGWTRFLSATRWRTTLPARLASGCRRCGLTELRVSRRRLE